MFDVLKNVSTKIFSVWCHLVVEHFIIKTTLLSPGKRVELEKESNDFDFEK